MEKVRRSWKSNSINFEELKKSILEQVDEFSRNLKERIEKLFNSYVQVLSSEYDVVEPPRPVPPEDPAVKWLFRTLRSVKEKHPELEYFFEEDDEGRIVALYFKAPDREVARDVVKPAGWAFRTASKRPRAG